MTLTMSLTLTMSIMMSLPWPFCEVTSVILFTVQKRGAITNESAAGISKYLSFASALFKATIFVILWIGPNLADLQMKTTRWEKNAGLVQKWPDVWRGDLIWPLKVMILMISQGPPIVSCWHVEWTETFYCKNAAILWCKRGIALAEMVRFKNTHVISQNFQTWSF